jgi:predicted transposase/invertase (TIGR01784 family)
MPAKQLISFDYAMKYILRDKSDFSIIEGFLSALLATANYKPVKVTALLETESNKDEARGKRIVADMVVKDTDGVQYIIEIERNEKYNFMHKACFSSSRIIVDSVGQGQDYSKIVKVIHISLLYFDIGGGNLYHGKTIFRDMETSAGNSPLQLHLTKPDGETCDLTDVLPEYFVISIPAFHDKINRSIDEWLYMMKHESIQESFKEKYIKLAAERLDFLKMSVAEKANYEYYQREMIDIREEFKTSALKSEAKGIQKGIKIGEERGIKIGKEEGVKIGEQKAQLKIARQLLCASVDDNTIAAATGLSVAQIKELKKT